jgi:UDP-N-acetylmuramyl pentapeptide phosphotransferase/UDP-N-acetylglucosamine-1-phosphate transferase
MDSLPFLILGYGLGTALLTWFLVGQLLRLAPRIGLLDRPNERSSHTRVTPRGGGIGFVVAIALAIGAYALVEDRSQMMDGGRWMTEDERGNREIRNGTVGQVADLAPELANANVAEGDPAMSPTWPTGIAAKQLFVALAAALFIAAISLRDDFKSLGAGLRFACHFAAAGAVIGAVGAFPGIDLPFLGQWTVPSGLGIALTLVWIVGLTNVYNFMDGIDGIAGVQGVAAGLGWLVAGIAFAAPTTAMLGAVLAAGCAGFLFHNWSPAKIFMGDVGSAFLGFLFAVVPLFAVREVPEAVGVWPVFGALVVWPFVGDGFLTFVRRLRKGEKVWEAHRSHLYQRLTQTGWKHAQVSRLYAGWAGLTVSVAWLWATDFPGAGWLVLVVPLGSLAALFAFVSRRERAE